MGGNATRKPLIYHRHDAIRSQKDDAHNDIGEHRTSSTMAGEDRGRRSTEEEKTTQTVIT